MSKTWLPPIATATIRPSDPFTTLGTYPFQWLADWRYRSIRKCQCTALIVGEPSAWAQLDRLGLMARTKVEVVRRGRFQYAVVAVRRP